MITAVDTSVLIAISNQEASWQDWENCLSNATNKGDLIICPVVFAEYSSRYTYIDEVRSIMHRMSLRWSGFRDESSFLAGQMFDRYRRNKGPRRNMIPDFLIMKHLGWYNTLNPLWVISFFGNAFNIFLLRQFFISIPRDYDEAARIDGASEFYIYRKIILPLSKPALATLFIFHFMYNWNDFLWPLVITTSQEMRTLPAGLALFMGQHTAEQALLLAGATLTLLPLLVAFLLAQRQFVRGVANTGIK